jgi:hypothetical protein
MSLELCFPCAVGSGWPPGLGVPEPATRWHLALVFSRFHETKFAGFVFRSFFGAFFQNGFASLFSGAAFGGFSGQRNHAFLCLRYPIPYPLLFFKPVRQKLPASKPPAAAASGSEACTAAFEVVFNYDHVRFESFPGNPLLLAFNAKSDAKLPAWRLFLARLIKRSSSPTAQGQGHGPTISWHGISNAMSAQAGRFSSDDFH